MLLLTSIDPMQFGAVCDTCRGRENELCGTRTEVITTLQLRGWRLDDGKEATCPDCAGPPSVFPAGRVTPVARHCSACGAITDVCSACHRPFGGDEVMSCRGQLGHVHARCSTQRMKKFEP